MPTEGVAARGTGGPGRFIEAAGRSEAGRARFSSLFGPRGRHLGGPLWPRYAKISMPGQVSLTAAGTMVQNQSESAFSVRGPGRPAADESGLETIS